MLSLLETLAGVQSDSDPIVNTDHIDADAPAESEPTGPAPDDAAWWADQQTGGCHPDDRSPEDRLIDSAMTALEYRLDQCGEEYRTLGLMEAGYAFC